jgi:hypothetical protein
MLRATNPAVAHCLERALECERLAEQAFDPHSKANFVSLARRWRLLAENQEFVDRMERFSGGKSPKFVA